MKECGAGSNCMRDPVPYLLENSCATALSIGRRRRGRKKERGGGRGKENLDLFILDLVFIQFGVAIFNPTTRRDVCHRLKVQF